MSDDIFCNQPHPQYQTKREVTSLAGTKSVIDAPTVWCRRPAGHDGDHAAYTLLISRPETWPAL